MEMSAAHGLEKRLFAANVVMATRRRFVAGPAERHPALPDAVVTGMIPASAAIASGWSNISRASPHSRCESHLLAYAGELERSVKSSRR